jgi:hypothetical protein
MITKQNSVTYEEFCYAGKEPHGKYFGCFKDNQKERDLANFNVIFAVDNCPNKCIDFCLTGSKFVSLFKVFQINVTV